MAHRSTVSSLARRWSFLALRCLLWIAYWVGLATYSATLRLFKVECGINGLLPTSWVPSIYSVSRLSRLRYALEEVTVFCVRQPFARSSLGQPYAKRKRVILSTDMAKI